MNRKTAQKYAMLVILLVIVYGTGVLTGYFTYYPAKDIYHSFEQKLRDFKTVKADYLTLSKLYKAEDESTLESTFYINGEEKTGIVDLEKTDDLKEVLPLSGGERLINYADGYSIFLQGENTFDFTYSSLFIKAAGPEYECTVSREYSPYDDIDEYFAFYLNRFVLNDHYREQNRITLLDNRDLTLSGVSANLISVRLEESPDDIKNVYTYALYKTEGRTYYRVMFKYRDYEKNWPVIEKSLDSMKFGGLFGKARQNQGIFEPKPAPFWNETTKRLYDDLQKPGEKVKWGIYTGQMSTYGLDEKIPAMEKDLDYQFGVVMNYFDIGNPPPVEFMEKAASQGRVIELTMHVTDNANSDVYGYTPMLDIYRGQKNDMIRQAARALKAVKTPFLLRLNNEMNSDWTSYSGVVNLSDPQIYKDVWTRIYRIFQEEGVENAIWVFNPNDRNYPPCNFNNYIAYFPGEEYVQMIGVTGYNTGTYYREVFGEEWRDFEDIYDHIQNEYQTYFSNYPWIITEFASSSYGGDKAKWISDMFLHLDKYQNIRIAVWYSCPDMDFRPEYEGKIARPYMLDETPETLAAFKEGLHNYLGT